MTSLARFNSGPNAKIPPLSEKQQHALKVFEEAGFARKYVPMMLNLATGNLERSGKDRRFLGWGGEKGR